jgi:prolipoprotein diacylglyceryltransferase
MTQHLSTFSWCMYGLSIFGGVTAVIVFAILAVRESERAK